jgi:hypothetical protein
VRRARPEARTAAQAGARVEQFGPVERTTGRGTDASGESPCCDYCRAEHSTGHRDVASSGCERASQRRVDDPAAGLVRRLESDVGRGIRGADSERRCHRAH